jgi:hypothetical protein
LSKKSVFKYAIFLQSDGSAGQFSTGVFKYAFFFAKQNKKSRFLKIDFFCRPSESIRKFSAFLKIDFFCGAPLGVPSHLLRFSSVILSVALIGKWA